MKEQTGVYLKVPANILKEIEQQAAVHLMTVEQYVLREILLKTRGCYIRCTKCNSVLVDDREVPTGGTYTIECHQCGEEVVVDDDDFDYNKITGNKTIHHVVDYTITNGVLEAILSYDEEQNDTENVLVVLSRADLGYHNKTLQNDGERAEWINAVISRLVYEY